MGHEKLCKVERGGDAYVQCVLELLKGTLFNTFHQWQGIVYYAVYLVVPLEYVYGKGLKSLLVGNVPNVMFSLGLVYDIYRRACLLELFGNAFPYSRCSAGNNNYFILEC